MFCEYFIMKLMIKKSMSNLYSCCVVKKLPSNEKIPKCSSKMFKKCMIYEMGVSRNYDSWSIQMFSVYNVAEKLTYLLFTCYNCSIIMIISNFLPLSHTFFQKKNGTQQSWVSLIVFDKYLIKKIKLLQLSYFGDHKNYLAFDTTPFWNC